MSATRNAIPNLTPISSVLSHEQRITRMEARIEALERDNREHLETIDSITEVLVSANNSIRRMEDLSRLSTAIDLAHSDRLSRLERVKQGDVRLTEVLGGIEARLERVESGRIGR